MHARTVVRAAQDHPLGSASPPLAEADAASPRATPATAFEHAFRRAFREHLPWLFRYIDRDTDDEALAADIAQEAFVRLYQRGGMPDELRAWLASVANNLLRDERRRRSRRQRLLAHRAPEHTFGDAPPSPEERVLDEERRTGVRTALDGMVERDRRLLLLRQEGLSYRELAAVLVVSETSVGTLLARARAAFRAAFPGGVDAP